MALATIGLEAGKGIVAKFGTGFLAGTLITLGAKNLLKRDPNNKWIRHIYKFGEEIAKDPELSITLGRDESPEIPKTSNFDEDNPFNKSFELGSLNEKDKDNCGSENEDEDKFNKTYSNFEKTKYKHENNESNNKINKRRLNKNRININSNNYHSSKRDINKYDSKDNYEDKKDIYNNDNDNDYNNSLDENDNYNSQCNVDNYERYYNNNRYSRRNDEGYMKKNRNNNNYREFSSSRKGGNISDYNKRYESRYKYDDI